MRASGRFVVGASLLSGLSPACLVLAISDVVKGATKPRAAEQTSVRPCQEAAESTRTTKHKRKQTAAQANAAKSCLEVHASSLDVQEHLQAFVREQRWVLSREDVSEALWSFHVALSAEELLKYAKPDGTSQRVDWRSGDGAVTVETAELGDGYVRAIVRAQFQGYGESDDALATQRSPWTLQSTGILETQLTQALRARYGGTK